ncbi:alpha/beta fold hydrolase [Methylobacterium sp. CM6257]
MAIALGLKYPEAVRGLILEGGYNYQSVRADAVMMSGPVVPLFGDVLRYTLSPLIARLMWPAMVRKKFAPAAVAESFYSFPSEMAVRPFQLRASSAEAVLMVPDAFAAQDHYGELAMPVAIVAGSGDEVVDIEDQARRFHRENPRSRLHVVEGCGHLVHHTAPTRVMSAVDEVAQAA